MSRRIALYSCVAVMLAAPSVWGQAPVRRVASRSTPSMTARTAPTSTRTTPARSAPDGSSVPAVQTARPVVPGTGVKLAMMGDDFEARDWSYIPNGAKASYEQDESQRPPGGKSTNGRWYESAMRGQPDVIRRIATPPGGLPGSTGSLYLATKFSGVPGTLSGKQMQDDLLMGIQTRLGRAIPVSWTPSVVVRVYLPEFDRWENRNGSSFGMRCDVRGGTPEGQIEPYWPGQFILFRSSSTSKYKQDYAQISVRSKANGQDVPGPTIEQPGWWTFGMTFTPDGQVHQYAHAGIEDLTQQDRLFSSFPYGNKTQFVDAFFVNVANLDNGRTWSTPWVIDDPAVYVVPPEGQTLANLTRGGGGGERQQQPTAVTRMFKSIWSR